MNRQLSKPNSFQCNLHTCKILTVDNYNNNIKLMYNLLIQYAIYLYTKQILLTLTQNN